MITCYVGKYRRNIAITKDDYHKMIIIISGSKVVDIKEEEIVHCMGKKRGYSLRHTLFSDTTFVIRENS